jgi:tetratricopeptide (TPR) repeat protein
MDSAKKAMSDKGASLWKAEQRRARISRAVRWGCGIPLALFSFPFLGFLGPFLALFGVILIAPDIASYLSRFAGNILWSHREGEPEPLYGIPESLVAKGEYAEAEQEYEKIIQEFPAEAKPHIDMINIAITRLHDAELAERLYQRGVASLPDGPPQEVLKKMYEAISTRLKEK